MSRRPSHIPKRKSFPKTVKVAVLNRSGGMCEAEGCNHVGKEFDHDLPVALGGPSTEDNCKLLCGGHHREKTDGDVARIAKADRAGGRSGQKARRDRAKAEGRYRPMKSRGFQGSRKFNGEVSWKTK